MHRKIKQQLTTTAINTFTAPSCQEELLHPVPCWRAPVWSPRFGKMETGKTHRRETLPCLSAAPFPPASPMPTPAPISRCQSGGPPPWGPCQGVTSDLGRGESEGDLALTFPAHISCQLAPPRVALSRGQVPVPAPVSERRLNGCSRGHASVLREEPKVFPAASELLRKGWFFTPAGLAVFCSHPAGHTRYTWWVLDGAEAWKSLELLPSGLRAGVRHRSPRHQLGIPLCCDQQVWEIPKVCWRGKAYERWGARALLGFIAVQFEPALRAGCSHSRAVGYWCTSSPICPKGLLSLSAATENLNLRHPRYWVVTKERF